MARYTPDSTGAPLALLGGRVRTWWAIGAWLFHIGIVTLIRRRSTN